MSGGGGGDLVCTQSVSEGDMPLEKLENCIFFQLESCNLVNTTLLGTNLNIG